MDNNHVFQDKIEDSTAIYSWEIGIEYFNQGEKLVRQACLRINRSIPELECNLENQKRVYRALQSLGSSNFSLNGKQASTLAAKSPILFTPRILLVGSKRYSVTWCFSYTRY